MEVKIGNSEDGLKSSGENTFVGGQSRWSYDTWTNWEVYPSEKLPILMYFKETQTKPEGQIVSPCCRDCCVLVVGCILVWSTVCRLAPCAFPCGDEQPPTLRVPLPCLRCVFSRCIDVRPPIS